MENWTKQNFNKFIDKYYELCETCKTLLGNKIINTINIYKPKEFDPLPQKLIEHIEYRFKYKGEGEADTEWVYYHGVNYETWGATYGVKYTEGKKSEDFSINVYVSAILRRPFTRHQRKTYDYNISVDSPCKRMRYIYDSSKDEPDMNKRDSDEYCEEMAHCGKVLYCKGDCTKCVKYTKY